MCSETLEGFFVKLAFFASLPLLFGMLHVIEEQYCIATSTAGSLVLRAAVEGYGMLYLLSRYTRTPLGIIRCIHN
jgi:hypothetical protein